MAVVSTVLIAAMLLVWSPTAAFAGATLCDDSNACTSGEMCVGTECLGGSPVNCPPDGDLCTVESCEPAVGCISVPVGCDDGNPCTDDSCDPGTGDCLHTPVTDGVSCDDDADDCVARTCQSGVCEAVNENAGEDCDDGNSCTSGDVCDAVGGCAGVPESDGVSCGDGQCATCLGGACDFIGPTGTPCDDGNLCTASSICVLGMCVGLDPTPCTSGDACSVGFCNPGTGACDFVPISCDDGNACTADACDSSTGCRFTPVPNGVSCDDGNECTSDDFCSAGVCVSGDTLPPDGSDTTLGAPSLSLGALAALAFGLGGAQVWRLRQRRRAGVHF